MYFGASLTPYDIEKFINQLVFCALKIYQNPEETKTCCGDVSRLICSLNFCEWSLGIRRHQDIETAVVCNIFDGNGEVAAGVASVESIVS